LWSNGLVLPTGSGQAGGNDFEPRTSGLDPYNPAPMDKQTTAALEAVESVFDEPELRVDLDFQPGQIQFVNNRATGHARTNFIDWPEPERKRFLVRLWLRDRGSRGYRG